MAAVWRRRHTNLQLDITEDDGYIKGFVMKQYINGRVPMGLEEIDITPKGITYLSENSNMQKVLKWIKTAKDITPSV